MALENQQSSIVQDQLRLRENMKALRGTAEEKQLLKRYAGQLDDQENRIETLRKEIADARGRCERARDDLNALIANFTYEA